MIEGINDEVTVGCIDGYKVGMSDGLFEGIAAGEKVGSQVGIREDNLVGNIVK